MAPAACKVCRLPDSFGVPGQYFQLLFESTASLSVKFNKNIFECCMHRDMSQSEIEFEVVGAMIKYVLDDYLDLAVEASRSCPDHAGQEEFDHLIKGMWGVYMAVLPETGQRVIYKFADRHVKDPVIAAKIRGITHLIRGTFYVTRTSRDLFTLVHEKDDTPYKVVATSEMQSLLWPGTSIHCIIYPWGSDNIYRLAVMVVAETPRNLMKEAITKLQKRIYKPSQDKEESMQVSINSSLAPILKKYPSPWIKDMCVNLKIRPMKKHKERTEAIAGRLTRGIKKVLDELSDDEITCLLHVYIMGGYAKYGQLYKKFGKTGDDGPPYNWSSNENTMSPIGLLRTKGLLVVGKMKMGTRNYKVAMIASDVMRSLGKTLRGDWDRIIKEIIADDDDLRKLQHTKQSHR